MVGSLAGLRALDEDPLAQAAALLHGRDPIDTELGRNNRAHVSNARLDLKRVALQITDQESNVSSASGVGR